MLLLSACVKERLAVLEAELTAISCAATRQLFAIEQGHVLAAVIDAVRAILSEKGFVQIRGGELDGLPYVVRVLIRSLGEIYLDPDIGSESIPAHVMPSQVLMGNQLRRLHLHTDYSMLPTPPRLTVSLCICEDPTPGSGSLVITDVESSIWGLERAPVIDAFFSEPFPFASQDAFGGGVTHFSPILSFKSSSGNLLTRYHRTRMVHGFKRSYRQPTERQSEIMLNFESHVARASETLDVRRGDLTVIDNHRCVHGRSRCSVLMTESGQTTGRRMNFFFVQ